jgi:uncharacterized protein YceK
MRKKMMTMVCAALAAMAALGGCGSIQGAAISAQAVRTADKMAIVDWKDHSLGELAAPGKILKLGASNSGGQNTAMTIADVRYAARLANQLKQPVLTRAGISLDSNEEFDAVNDAATKTLVTIAGQERLTDFWQKVKVTDSNGRKQTVYHYYVVYACDEAV